MESSITVIIALLMAILLVVAGFGLISFAIDLGDESFENATEDGGVIDPEISGFSGGEHLDPKPAITDSVGVEAGIFQ